MKTSDPLGKIIDLIEKEIALFDKRPKKQRKIHPSGECYINDIMRTIDKYYERKKSKKTKKTV